MISRTKVINSKKKKNERENVQNLQSEYQRNQKIKRTLATKTQGRGEQKRKEKESKELTNGGYVEKWNDFQLKDLTDGLKHG